MSPGVPDGSDLSKNDVNTPENHQGHLGTPEDGWGQLGTPGVPLGQLASRHLADVPGILAREPYTMAMF